MTETFSLVHQAWVPVVEAGRRREVSLLEALTRAQDFDGLALDDPLQAVAVLRQVLLPLRSMRSMCPAPRMSGRAGGSSAGSTSR